MEFVSLNFANQKMRQRKYDDALFIYQELVKKTPSTSPIVKFNIDYCLYKLGLSEEFLSESSEPFWIESESSGVLRNFGTGLLGPILLMFFKNFSKQNFSEIRKIFFFGREGFFLTKAFEILLQKSICTQPEAVYLNISRRFLFKLCLSRTDLIPLTLERSYDGSVEEFLFARYGFSKKEIGFISPFFHSCGVFSISLPLDKNLIDEIFSENIKYLEDIISPKYLAYKEYLHSLGVFDEVVSNYVDLGYSGTTQRILSKLYGLKTVGHYFFTTEKAINTESEIYIGHILHQDRLKSGNALIERSSYLESVLTAPVGTLLDIIQNSKNFDFIFDEKMRPQIYFDAIDLIAQGAIDYANKNFFYEGQMSYEDLVSFYTNFVASKNSFPKKVQDILEMDDIISGIEVLNPVKYFLGDGHE